MIKKCQKCGNEFKGKKNQIFCSKKCAHKKVEQIEKVCELEGCNNVFLIYPNTKNYVLENVRSNGKK